MKKEDWISPREKLAREGDRLSWGIVAVIAIIVLLALMAKPAKAQAIEPSFSATTLELEVGQTRYASVDGVWFNSLDGRYHNTLTPASWQLAVRIPSWRAGFTWLGSASSAAEWGPNERGDELSDASLSRVPLYAGSGRGEAAGIWIGKNVGWNVGATRLEIEGGPFLYYRHWREEYWPLSDPSNISIDETRSINLTLYAAATLRYERLIVEARIYNLVMNGAVGGTARQIMAGMTVPF